MPKNLIFLAFANDRKSPERFLKALEPERTSLHRTLSKYQEKGWGLYHSAGSSNPLELKRDLTQHSGKIIIFHFSGHGSGTTLQLEGEKGEAISLNNSGLLAFLNEEPALKLVFLNACATQEHVRHLFSVGVPAVLATDVSIQDEQAKAFSNSFYSDLVQGKSLKAAFLGAKAAILSDDTEDRIYRGFRIKEKIPKAFPWGLHVQSEEVLNWTLEPETEDKLTPTKKVWKFLVAASVIIGLIGGIAAFTGFNLQSFFTVQPKSHALTVFVHGQDGRDQVILPNRGMVSLVYGGEKSEKQINDRGEVVFKQIPAAFFDSDKKVEIFFKDPLNEPYRAIYPDSLYSLEQNQPIYLPVSLMGLSIVKGVVKNIENGDFISGAKIIVQGESTLSNEDGYYELMIPEEKQKAFQTIRASKDGFQSFERGNVPIHPDQEVPIMMRPR